MSWPLSLISDVVLFKFSPVKKTSIRPKYCSGTIQPNIQAKFVCYHHVFVIMAFSLKSFQNSLNFFYIINKLKLWKMIVGS